jgi:acetyl-CoA carboxylase biotin carboxyl carrier protein
MKGLRKMAEKDTDLKKIKELVALMVENDLVEVEIIDGDNKIALKRPQSSAPVITTVPIVAPHYPATVPTPAAVPQAAATAQPAPDDNLIDIKSPIVGTFYSAPSPDSDPYVKVGVDVNPETVVCIIEAMKVMNEIKAEISGTVARIMVANGQAVEYGQVLFKVRPH